MVRPDRSVICTNKILLVVNRVQHFLIYILNTILLTLRDTAPFFPQQSHPPGIYRVWIEDRGPYPPPHPPLVQSSHYLD